MADIYVPDHGFVELPDGSRVLPTARRCVVVAEVIPLFERELWSPFVPASRHDSWCTPTWLVDLILRFWPDGVDVDPCTNESSVVPARVRYDGNSLERDGLKQCWRGDTPRGRDARVYANPPYSVVKPWYERAAEQALGRDEQRCEVLLLVNVTTSTDAWNKYRPRMPATSFDDELELCRRGEAALPRSSAVGFFNSRISFLDAGVPVKGNAYEQMILYWGRRVAEFRHHFEEVAWCP